ncbi:hypothetical protein [Paenibacillus lautus]|nr:hypothetical protein [Paenibacillus lautus]
MMVSFVHVLYEGYYTKHSFRNAKHPRAFDNKKSVQTASWQGGVCTL